VIGLCSRVMTIAYFMSFTFIILHSLLFSCSLFYCRVKAWSRRTGCAEKLIRNFLISYQQTTRPAVRRMLSYSLLIRFRRVPAFIHYRRSDSSLHAAFTPDACNPDTSCIHLYPFVSPVASTGWRKKGATISLQIFWNSMTELRENWWTSAILYAEHSH